MNEQIEEMEEMDEIKRCRNCNMKINFDTKYVYCYNCHIDLEKTKVNCSTKGCISRILPHKFYKKCYRCNMKAKEAKK